MWIIDSSGKSVKRKITHSEVIQDASLQFCKFFFEEETYEKILLRWGEVKEIYKSNPTKFKKLDLSPIEGIIIKNDPTFERPEFLYKDFVVTYAEWEITNWLKIRIYLKGETPPRCKGEILHTEIINKEGFEWECVRCGSLYFSDGRLKKLNMPPTVIDKPLPHYKKKGLGIVLHNADSKLINPKRG